MHRTAYATDASQRHARSILTISPATKPVLARNFDREADIELALGHHQAAEQLAWRAAEMREAGR